MNARIWGQNEERRIVSEYRNGIDGDFAVDFMRNISVSGMKFNEFAYNHDIGGSSYTDATFMDGKVFRIVELKTGEIYTAKHYAQVMRYAFAFMNVKEYDSVIMDVVYTDRKEVVTYSINREDIEAEYSAVRHMERGKHYAEVGGEGRKAFNERRQARRAPLTAEGLEKARIASKIKRAGWSDEKREQVRDDGKLRHATRTDAEVKANNDRVKAKRANWTDAERNAHNAETLKNQRIRAAKRTPAEAKAYRAQNVVDTHARFDALSPEDQKAQLDKLAKDKRDVRANWSPEKKAEVAAKAKARRANMTQEQKDARNARVRASRAAKKASLK